MALIKKVYGVKASISSSIFGVHGVLSHHPENGKTVALQSEIANLSTFQLQLQFVSYKRNKFRVGWFSLGVGHGIAKEALQSIQIAPVPSHLDGMTNGSFDSAGGGLECLGDLWVQYLGDGIGGLAARPGVLPDRGVWRGICE